MSSLTNINNNASVVNVGRTTPVTPGVKPASQSIPVVIATDQPAIPVIEQQKIQSEVALSLLGIPRGEVALGIFSDVNTYDVNPTEWSSSPAEYTIGHGIQHRPSEAGALVQAGKDKMAVLSSKRFFRYQPGRVSAATFGVKSSVSPTPVDPEDTVIEGEKFDRNPAIRKYGIFDNFDGYYWESRGDGKGDNFATIRRTQSLNRYNPLPFTSDIGGQIKDYRIVGKQADDPSDEPNAEPNAIQVIQDSRFAIIDSAYNAAVAVYSANTSSTEYIHLTTNADKCKRDASFAIDAYVLDIQYGGTGHTVTNATTYRTALLGSGDALKQAAEQQLHTQLRATLKTYLSGFSTLNTVARNTRIDTLTQYIINAVGGTQPTSELTSTSTSIWARNKILTIFAIYKRYLGYLVSESFVQTNYTTPIKYKCYRDIGYIVDGYARDLAYGGNSATVYNMKNFYFNDVRQVTTNFGTGNGVVAFHQRAHTLLKQLISKSTNVTTADDPDAGSSPWDLTRAILKGASASGFTSVFTLFGLANVTAVKSTKTIKDKFDQDLFTPLYDNFTTEYNGLMEFGSGPQFGDLITLRDGLIHIHAGVYDPSLLKKVAPIRVNVDPTANTIEASTGEFVVNQFITFKGDAGGLVDGKIYGVASVSGPRNNVITLYDPAVNNEMYQTKTVIDITSVGSANNYIEIGTPFVFPRHYFVGPQPGTNNNYTRYDGMFPYMYAKPEGNAVDGSLGDLPAANPDPNTGSEYTTNFINRVGYINTSYDLSGGTDNLKREIDYINYLYNNWIKQNVDPKYYAVYEYRVPRSRFSADKLDAIPDRNVVYSDVAFGELEDGNIATVRPGLNVYSDGNQTLSTSVWSLDPENVAMLKIEFSWYGAVGALFLAYVPVGNGEARWVRVHHMRASNQLKVASLGNATLPITYLTYGGGSENKLGIIDTISKGYDSTSDHIVKYGASYYIDGGDRGTVRLYSHTNNTNTKTYGKIYDVGTVTTTVNTSFETAFITIPSNVGPADKTFFMKSQVVTGSVQDQNVRVEWVDGNKLYINKNALVSTNNVKIISERPSVAFGLKAKQNILNSVGFGVRNRVQVYPTKLSTANFGSIPVKMDVVKTPLFQPNVTTNGSFVLTAQYSITSDNLPLPTSSTSYMSKDEDFVYGWFRARIGTVQGTVFGRLYRDNGGLYYFEMKDVFSAPVTLFSGADYPFLKDGRFDFQGNTIPNGTLTDSSVEKERLSSVFINNTIQSPVPQTGIVNASFFLKPGSDQFDLLSYFDYNKDYLSYPLTDEVSSIYLMSSSISEANSTPAAEINVGMTWEEQ
jgi:hypothetical protein